LFVSKASHALTARSAGVSSSAPLTASAAAIIALAFVLGGLAAVLHDLIFVR